MITGIRSTHSVERVDQISGQGLTTPLAIAEEPLAWGLELAKKRERRFRKGVKRNY